MNPPNPPTEDYHHGSLGGDGRGGESQWTEDSNRTTPSSDDDVAQTTITPEDSIDSFILSTRLPTPPGRYWRASECLACLNGKSPFKVKEFNHLTKECLALDISVQFYCNLLGFQTVPRPPFESEGTWLWGHGLNLHLIQTKQKRERQADDILRLMHYKGMPIADHFAFVVDNVKEIESFLSDHGVFYYQADNLKTGIYQLFLFDPDYNVVELSNCAPPVGQIQCSPQETSNRDAASEI